MGAVHYGDVGPASVGYCLKYLMKKGQVPKHSRDDRQPEFSLMSKRLGSNYLTPEMVQWHLNDVESRLYCTTLDNVKITMPRYYKNKLFTDAHFESQEQADFVRRKAGFIALQRLHEKEAQERLLQEGLFDHNKVQHDLHSFREMAAKADMGKTL